MIWRMRGFGIFAKKRRSRSTHQTGSSSRMLAPKFDLVTARLLSTKSHEASPTEIVFDNEHWRGADLCFPQGNWSPVEQLKHGL